MRYSKLVAIGVLALAATSCRKKSAFDADESADLQTQNIQDIVITGTQPVTPGPDVVITSGSPDDDVPKVSCNRSSVDESGAHIGTCSEYFVGPEESLQVDKATELEAACIEEGGVWDVQGCRVEDNLLGTCKTPASGSEPAINELVYGTNKTPVNGDVSDDSQTSCAKPSVWVEKN